jgi:hypothetical protein
MYYISQCITVVHDVVADFLMPNYHLAQFTLDLKMRIFTPSRPFDPPEAEFLFMDDFEFFLQNLQKTRWYFYLN